MVLSQYRCAIGTFDNRQNVESALNQLKSAGFSMERISVLAKESAREQQQNQRSTNEDIWLKTTDNNAKCATVTGSMIGAIGGCLIGLGLLVLPGIGPLVAIGTSGTALAATLAGVGIGAASGGLLEALSGSARTLELAPVASDRSSPNSYLIIVSGMDDEMYHAEFILRKAHSTKVEIL